MADGRRRQVAPVRKLVAAVLGTFATFVVLFGFGMRSWAIAVLGVALLALAIALVAVTAVRSGPRAWVTGIGHVHSVTEPPASSTFGRCELQIVIDAPGVPGRSVRIRDPRVPVSKWPDPGATLPIMVAVDDQRHVRILWDEVLTHAEAAASGDLPPEFHLDPVDDDILIEQEAPPWARGGRDDPYGTDPSGGAPVGDELTEDDLATLRDDPERLHDNPERLRNDPERLHDNPERLHDEPERLRDDRGTAREEPVVMRQTPGGTIVLEGTLVDPPSTAPLPRRPRPTSGPGGRNRRPRPGPTAATAPVSDPPPAPRPPEPDEPERETPEPAPGTPEQAGAGGEADAAPGGPGRSATTAGGTDPADTWHDEIDIPLDDPAPELATGLDPRAGAASPEDVAATSDDEAILADLTATQPPARLGESGPIAGVGITLLVADLERSIAFYRDLLGFFEIDGGEGSAVLASGATRLVLRAIREVAPINRRLVHLNLEVNDVTAFYEELLGKGVKFTYAPRAVNRGAKLELWAAAFRDPDGHGIALTQWRHRATG
ncbi:VOC family protein [Plantactinospora sp. B6F1]|uniref:VOC family protein n=1 Tax=Plantactinospora sp. B6F1 TaxID=3158971 RepID=UPI0032D8DA06